SNGGGEAQKSARTSGTGRARWEQRASIARDASRPVGRYPASRSAESSRPVPTPRWSTRAGGDGSAASARVIRRRDSAGGSAYARSYRPATASKKTSAAPAVSGGPH